MKMEHIPLLKGIRPGIILERELKKRDSNIEAFAAQIGASPITIIEIINGKNNLPTELAHRIEHALGIEEGFFMTLQTYFDIKETQQKNNKTYQPDLTKFRKSLFWDTDMNTIDWINQKHSIIQRFFERGNDEEKSEITRCYGEIQKMKS